MEKPSLIRHVKAAANKLKDSKLKRLASRFDFSGGEIDNVVRKATMEEILQGTTPTLKHLFTLCEEERIEKGGQGIGFNPNRS